MSPGLNVFVYSGFNLAQVQESRIEIKSSATLKVLGSTTAAKGALKVREIASPLALIMLIPSYKSSGLEFTVPQLPSGWGSAQVSVVLYLLILKCMLSVHIPLSATIRICSINEVRSADVAAPLLNLYSGPKSGTVQSMVPMPLASKYTVPIFWATCGFCQEYACASTFASAP